jgi:hypothetical protein
MDCSISTATLSLIPIGEAMEGQGFVSKIHQPEKV